MKKKKENHERLFILLGVVVAFIVVALLMVHVQQRSLSTISYENISVTPTTSSASQTYYSKTLKMSLTVPGHNYKITPQTINISLENDKGEILISRSGTNYDNLDDYLVSLSNLNHISFASRENIDINSLKAIKAIIDDKNYYFIYADYWVYSISTTSPELYDDLDMIARSFRYIP